ncbi:MAG: hypothetical protein ACI8RD_003373 [Bacillariaceae sp.]|jgi:hypothetical protein
MYSLNSCKGHHGRDIHERKVGRGIFDDNKRRWIGQ